MENCLTIFKQNLEAVSFGGHAVFHDGKGNNAKHRKKKFKDGRCSLCIYSKHEPQEIDINPSFDLLKIDTDSIIIKGNDGEKNIQIISNFFHMHNRENIKMTLYGEYIKTRFHKIYLTEKKIPVVGFSAKSKELFIDIDDEELSVLIDRLSRDAEIHAMIIPPEESGFSNVFDWTIFDFKTASGTNLSPISVSPWVKWNDISQLEDYFDKNGVYMFGLFKDRPPQDSTLEKEIVYIGITAKRNFRKRLKEFYSCAMTNGTGHSGGCEFRRRYIKKEFKTYSEFPMPADTYVRLIATSYSYSKIIQNVIEDFESRLIFLYENLYGSIPLCNRKY